MALTDGAGIFLKISANSDQATEEFKKLRKEFKETETQIKKSSGFIETAFLGFAQGAGLSGKEAAHLKANVTDLAKVATVAAAGMAAVGGAIVAAGVGMFKLASSAAEAGSKIYDVTVKTGLAAETVSTLKLAADKSGVSMESMGTIISRFSKVVGEAAQGSKEAQETLTRLGIEPQEAINNLDGALGKVFAKIQSLPDPISRATLAQQAFGKSGTELLKVIDDFQGNLPAAIAEAKRLGLVMSGEDVRAADEFADKMQVVERQLEMVKIKIGQQLMPVFLDMAKRMSTWLASNQGEVTRWGTNFANVIGIVAKGLSNIKTALDEFDDLLRAALAGDTWEQFKQRVAQRAAADAAGTAIGSGGLDPKTFTITTGTQANADGTPIVPTNNALTDYDAIKKAQDDAKKAAEQAQKEADELRKRQLQGQLGQIKAIQDAEQHALDRITAANKAALDAKAITSKQYLDQRLADEEEYAKKAIADVTKEYELKRQQEKLSSEQLKALKIQEDNELQKIVDNRFAHEEEAKKEAAEHDKKLADDKKELTEKQLADEKAKIDRSLALQDAENAQRYAAILLAASQEKKSAEDVAKFKQFLEEDFTEYKINKLKDYLGKLIPGTKEYLDVQNQIKILEAQLEAQRAVNAVNDKKRREDAIDDLQEYYDELERVQKLNLEQSKQDVSDQRKKFRRDTEGASITGGGGFGGSLADSLGVDLISIFGDEDTIKSQAEFMKDIYADVASSAGAAVGSMVDGLAQLVTQWLVTGKFSAKAALQMAAGIAAGLAVQSAVKAIYELAEGFAALGNPFLAWTAPFHFKAAATYGLLALGAGAGAYGLGAASRSFNKEASTATGSSSYSGANRNVGGQGSAYSSQPDGLIEQGRNTPAPRVTLVIEDRSDGFHQLFRASIANNGPMRQTLKDAIET